MDVGNVLNHNNGGYDYNYRIPDDGDDDVAYNPDYAKSEGHLQGDEKVNIVKKKMITAKHWICR